MFDTEKNSWATGIRHFSFAATDKAQNGWAHGSHDTDVGPLVPLSLLGAPAGKTLTGSRPRPRSAKRQGPRVPSAVAVAGERRRGPQRGSDTSHHPLRRPRRLARFSSPCSPEYGAGARNLAPKQAAPHPAPAPEFPVETDLCFGSETPPQEGV